MLLLVHVKTKPEARDKAFERLKQTGHNASAGVNVLNAFYAIHQHESWIIAEANDPIAIGKWLYAWSDLCDHEVVPIVDDEGMRKILGP